MTARYCDVVVPRVVQDELTYSLETVESEGVAPGDSVRVTLHGRPVVGIVFGLRENSPVKRTLAVSEIVTRGLFTSEMLDLVRWLAQDYCSRLGEALGRVVPRGVEQTGCADRLLLPAPGAGSPGLLPPGVWVSSRMRDRYERVADHISAGIAQGSVLLLVPQEELSRWLLELRRGFPDALVEYHARMRLVELRKAWARIRWSRCQLIVGMRSAVLAPTADLAAIVMVDEHDTGYKEERQPRFHSRDVAVWRANRVGCPLLIIDSTPSLETWAHLRSGNYRWAEPPAGSVVRPDVFVVDMRRHRGELFSPRLVRELERVRQRGGSAIMYINRLGTSRHIVCSTCGWVLACATCGVSFVLSKGMAYCRYCGLYEPAPDRCPHCRGNEFSFRAPGTEMFVNRLRLLLGVDSARVDEVTSVTAKAVPREGMFYVGTRACLNRPWPDDTVLVAALGIDSDLAIPDFRSRERVFQILRRLCQRAQEKAARVLIQTYRPEDTVISAAIEDRMEEFVETELSLRREARFPPYVRLVQFRLSSNRRGARVARHPRLYQSAETLKKVLSQKRGCQVLGPVVSPDASIVRLLVKAPLRMRGCDLVAPSELQKLGVRVQVDVDPLVLA